MKINNPINNTSSLLTSSTCMNDNGDGNSICCSQDSDNMIAKGFSYLNKNNEMALKYFHKAANLGNIVACFYIGNMHYHGIGVDLDNIKAIEWYKKAADNGHSLAVYYLADVYYEVKKYSEAYVYF